MINLTRLWTGQAQPADDLRYGRGHASPHSARARRPIVVWNITRTCNLRCVHCYSDSMAMKYPGELSWEQMQEVVKDLAGYRIPSRGAADPSAFLRSRRDRIAGGTEADHLHERHLDHAGESGTAESG